MKKHYVKPAMTAIEIRGCQPIATSSGPDNPSNPDINVEDGTADDSPVLSRRFDIWESW